MDEELGAPAGSPADLERLLRANARSMLRFADFVLHDRSAAEDAVQEAFMIAYQRRSQLRDESVFTAWLRTIVLRECLRWRRRRFLQVLGLTDRVVAPATPDPGIQLDLARAVRRLSPKLRAIVYLHYYEDLTLGRVASQLSIPESTAKTRLYEALRRLQLALPGYAPPSNAGEHT
jgi:RNA polymerase sigma-70 factor (ECF subfamily)